MSIKRTYPVRGMTCAACARNVENILETDPGVENASVNYAMHQVQVISNQEQSFRSLQQLVQSIGYDLADKSDHQAEQKRRDEDLRKTKLKLIWAVVFTIPLFILSMFIQPFRGSNYLQLVLTLPVVGFSGIHFYKSAIKKIIKVQFNMDTLIALGTGSAFLFSLINTLLPSLLSDAGLVPHVYYESAAVIITLILLGNYIEEHAKRSTSQAVDNLLALQPHTVIRLNGEEEEEVPVDAIMPNDTLRIKPGTNIPLDGIIVSGMTSVDESMLTGESIPISKKEGESVTGGTQNIDGSIWIKVARVGNDTVLAQIINRVEEALGSKAPAQRLADRISAVFVPVVIILAVVISTIWFLFGPEPRVINSFVVGITILIIACPCALGLATPTAITVAMGRGASMGILIRDAEVFDQMRKVTTLFIDKTGTLTTGKLRVIESHYSSEYAKELNGAILNAERQSEHPIGQAIVDHLKGVAPVEIDRFQNLPGQGVTFRVNDQICFLGKIEGEVALIEEFSKVYEKHPNKGMVAFYIDKKLQALFVLEDQIKQEAKAALERLKSSGIETIMLTGDRKGVADRVAIELEISYHAELKPEEKAAVITGYQKKGKTVAMAGDGVNDAPALAVADVSLAMSTGTDVAMSAAGITLLKGDLSKVSEAIDLSCATSQTIRQNLFWAFAYNVVAIPIAAGILYPLSGFLLNPMIAGGAMAFSSVTVVFNSLRLRSKRF